MDRAYYRASEFIGSEARLNYGESSHTDLKAKRRKKEPTAALNKLKHRELTALGVDRHKDGNRLGLRQRKAKELFAMVAEAMAEDDAGLAEVFDDFDAE
jgi:hypothetical protein